MKKKLRGLYLLISSCFIAILHLPFAFAKSAAGASKLYLRPDGDSVVNNTTAPGPVAKPVMRSVYDSLHLDLKGLSQQAFQYAKKGLQKLVEEGKLLNDSIISIVDFSLPSYQKRLFVLDLKNYRVLYHTLVAHGKNTGREWATAFSNKSESHQSSPGFYITRETYEGNNGYSLKLEGMEAGINDRAYARGIVVHGAAYVNEDYARSQGYIGRSHGCPAVPAAQSKPIINTIRNGTCLFVYHPSYIDQSPLLN